MLCMFHDDDQARLGSASKASALPTAPISRPGFAQERKQGRAVGKKGDGLDPDHRASRVKRMLLQMRAMTAAPARSATPRLSRSTSPRAPEDPKVQAEAAARGAC